MALEGPLRSSTGSAFSSPMDMSISSPESTSAPRSQFRPMSTSALESGSFRPTLAASRPLSSNNYLLSPVDMVGPSPVTSIGTEVTEIDDEEYDEVRSQPNDKSPDHHHPQMPSISTNISDQIRQSTAEGIVSVIHAPKGFQSWSAADSSPRQSDSVRTSSPKSSSPVPASEDTAVSPPPPDRVSKVKFPDLPTPHLRTNIKPVKYSIDSATPRAQTLQEILGDSPKARPRSASSLELIPESKESETDGEPDLDSYDDEEEYGTPIREKKGDDVEITSLKAALQECWTLCNTLANLSTHHRERVFSTSGTPDGYEKAWKCCWELCRRLYDNREDTEDSFNVRQNLDLCRDFCQALFDVRDRSDEVADSILRVSFELNNHLYSAQDSRNLPEAFRERTLDFYITLCHRLMKQRGELGEETDSLLSACWSLAEMLFSLQQNKRNGKAADERLLGSAVQACWELCDMFRAGWTQVRPDRGTPRPGQAGFLSYGNRDWDAGEMADGRESRTSSRSKPSSLKNPSHGGTKPSRNYPPVPETPCTEFEDTPVSPDTESPSMPNILVLGTDSNRGGRWSSSASNLSSYSQSSQRTSSTATTTATTSEESNITRIKMLVLKAAMNLGFSRDSASDGHHSSAAASLPTFVKSLPTGSFGSLPSQAALLQNYKNLVVTDSSFRQASSLPKSGKRVYATDVAKSVGWMMHRSGQYGYLRDLFKFVFGFQVEDADNMRTVTIAV